MRFILILIYALASIGVFAQGQVLNGTVRDSASSKPLAFVSIQVEGQAEMSAMSDIDGKFSIQFPEYPVKIRFSYIGYKMKSLRLESKRNNNLSIYLSPVSLVLKEVQIKAGENPAHRIIRRTWENRELHDPSALNTYRCNTYNKLILTGRKDTAWTPLSRKDSVGRKLIDSLFTRQHLFMIESYSTRLFKKGKSKEIVKASKVSGSKEASVFMLALQYQPFTFYEPLVEVSGKKYLNPVSRNSEALYFFSLEDTLFSGRDTIFVITYKPRKGKVFDALKGVLYISAPDFAIQNVIAEPAEESGLYKIKIQQQYKRLDSGQWFPEQLNTDLNFLNFSFPGNKMVGESRIYVSSPEINPVIKDREFDEVSIEVESSASERADAYWDSIRVQQLTMQERRTYRVIDSISKAQNLQLRMKIIESVIRGYVPIKFFDLDVTRIIGYNQLEGFRLGVGGITNDRLFKRFGIGGYYAYGFGDQKHKYQALGKWYITPDQEYYLGFSWGRDVYETGAVNLLRDRKPKMLETIRDVLVGRMQWSERTQLELGFRLLNFLSATVFVRQSHNTALFDYRFRTDALHQNYSWLEQGIAFRYAWGEKYYKSGNLKILIEDRFPVLFGQVTYGKDLNGGADFIKTDLKVEKSFETRRIGQTHLQVLGGYVEGNVPVTQLYTGRSNLLLKDRLRVSSFNAFETMQMNEILCDRYVAMFFQQDFGSFFRIKKWSPKFSITQASIWGRLYNAQYHHLINTADARNGFFEAGLKISELIRYSTASYGAGAFYRFGSFADADWKKNIFFKFNVGLVF